MLTKLLTITPSAVNAFCRDPGAHFVTSLLRAPLVGPHHAVARAVRVSWDPDRSDSLPLDALAEAALTTAERRTWESRQPSPRRRRQWLLGRLAAKDAARVILRDVLAAVVLPTDLEVTVGAYGRPELRVTSLHPARDVHISIAHTGETAVALASMDPGLAGLGIDVERIRPRLALERKGLTAGERRRLADIPTKVRPESVLRWWCAKEAVAKALGEGLDRLGGATSMTVTPVREDSGLLDVQIASTAERRYDRLLAATSCDGEYVVATAVAWPPTDCITHDTAGHLG